MMEIGVEEASDASSACSVRRGWRWMSNCRACSRRCCPAKRETRKLSVRDARKVLFNQEAEKLIDKEKIQRTAIERVEQSGIVFLDEIDKVAGHRKQARSGREPAGRAA